MLSLSRVALYRGPNPFCDEAVLVSRVSCAHDAWSRYNRAIPRLISASSDWYRPKEHQIHSPDLALGAVLADWSLQALTFIRGYLRPIRFDASALLHLAGQGLQPETVLPQGRIVRLRSNGNLSTGGECIDVTHEVHRDIRILVESLAETLGITMLGADYMTSDISRSPREIAGGFIEINTTPGLGTMIAAGWSTEKAGALALSSGMGADPKTLIIMPADKFDRLLAGVQARGWPVGIGWASRVEAAVSGAGLRVPEGQGWTGVDMLLGHRAVARAILLASDQEILRFGMPVSKVDHLVLAARLPAAWEQVLSNKATVVEPPGATAEPEELIAQLADHDFCDEGIFACHQ